MDIDQKIETIEQNLLGFLITLPHTFQDVMDVGLKSNHFYWTRHQLLFKEMERQWQEAQAFDSQTLYAGLVSLGKDGTDALNYGEHANYLSYLEGSAIQANFLRGAITEANTIVQAYWERKTSTLAGAIASLRNQGKSPQQLGLDIQELTTAFMTELKESEVQPKNKPKPGKEIGDIALAMYSSYLVGHKPKFIATGISSLDFAMNGGFEHGTHVSFLAASGTGKTIFLKQMALEFARQGYRVVYYLMESTEEFLTRRIMAEQLRINPVYLKRNEVPNNPDCPKCKDLDAPKQWLCSCRKEYKPTFDRLYSEAVMEYQSLPIRIEARALDINKWQDAFLAEHRERPIDVAIFDYGQKVRYPNGQDVNTAHARFADDISAMALEYKCLALTALQVKKEGGAGISRPPQVNDIKGTTAWYNACDYILSLFRPKISVDNIGNDVHDTKGAIHFIKTRDSAGSDSPVNVELVGSGLYFKPITITHDHIDTTHFSPKQPKKSIPPQPVGLDY